MKWWQICKLEIRQMFITDRRRAVFLFGASLAYLILFSLLYSAHVIKNVPIIIYDEDQTQFSRQLIQAFDDSERVQIISYVTNQEDMENELREKEAYAAIHIPQKFAQNAKLGLSSPVLLIANGSNIMITNAVSTATQEIIAAFAKDTGTKLIEAAGQMPHMAINKTGPIDFRLRVLNNPTQSYLYFFAIGLAMAAFQQGVFLSVGASLLADPNISNLKNTPIVTVMVGKLLPYWVCATLAFFLTLIVAINIFSIPCKVPMMDFFMLSSTFVFAAIGFSSLVASVSSNEVNFTRVSVAYTVPAFVLSGYLWPQLALDAISLTLSYTFPLTYFSNTVRELMIAGYSPVLYRNCFILFLFGTLTLTIASICYTRKLIYKLE